MIKKILFAFCLLLGTHVLHAQRSNFVVFSEKGEPFTLVMNGHQINPTPAQNVKVTNLKPAQYSFQVIFNNPSIPVFEEAIFVNSGNEVTYALQRDQSGNSIMRFVNEFSLTYRPIPPANQQVLPYTWALLSQPITVVRPPVTVPDPVAIDVQVDIVPDPTTQDPPIVAPTTVTTMTVEEPAIIIVEPVPVDVIPDPLPGYTGPIGCESPMNADGFSSAKTNIDSKSFSDSKMRVAKQIARTNCMLTTQIKDIMEMFSFETDKLEFAKFAYDFTYDQGNYYKINDAFSFEHTIAELEKYLQNR